MLKIEIVGNVGTCRLVTAAGKSPVLNISLAANRKMGDREFVDWVSVKVWGERASKLSPHIGKGTKLLVIGRPEARPYKANDGTPKAELVVHAAEIEFLSAKGHDFADEPSAHVAEEPELPLATAAA